MSLENVQSFLLQQFDQSVVSTFINFCNEEEYEELNIEEDIEEPKDSYIFEQIQSKLHWNASDIDMLIQALQNYFRPSAMQQTKTINTGDQSSPSMTGIYSNDYPPLLQLEQTKINSELQSIADKLSVSYQPQTVKIFIDFCAEQEYEQTNIIEDIEEDNDSFIFEHMQSECHWNAHKCKAFIAHLHKLLNPTQIPKKLQKTSIPNMKLFSNHRCTNPFCKFNNFKNRPQYHRPNTAHNFDIHAQIHAMLQVLMPKEYALLNEIRKLQMQKQSTSNAPKPLPLPPTMLSKPKMGNNKYATIDVETRAKISLRRDMKYKNTLTHSKPAPFVSETLDLDTSDDVYDEWKSVNESWMPKSMSNVSLLNGNVQTNIDKMVGLKNIGATCYMNAVLQALNCSDMYREWLLNSVNELEYSPKYAQKYFSKYQTENEIRMQYMRQQNATIELKKILRTLAAKRERVTDTKAFVRRIPKRWRPGKQQDSNEFAKFVLNCVWETIDQSCIMKDIYDNIGLSVSEAYQLKQLRLDPFTHGMLNYTTKCMNCECKSAKFEAFFDLALALPMPKNEKLKLSTKALISEHMSAECLSSENSYFCNKCGQNVTAVRYISIVRPPKLLLICFKRYKLDLRLQTRAKVMTRVDCPLLLQIDRDITDAANNERVPYLLYAVVVHSGSNAGFGHYYSIGRSSTDALKCYKNYKSSQNAHIITDVKEQMNERMSIFNGLDGGNWYRFDDERVSKASYKEINTLSLNDTPYMLFYLRID